MKLNELKQRDHLKEYLAKRLFKEWQNDPAMPIEADSIEDMEKEDKEMFWDMVADLTTQIKKSKLPLDQAYDKVFDDMAKDIQDRVHRAMH